MLDEFGKASASAGLVRMEGEDSSGWNWIGLGCGWNAPGGLDGGQLRRRDGATATCDVRPAAEVLCGGRQFVRQTPMGSEKRQVSLAGSVTAARKALVSGEAQRSLVGARRSKAREKREREGEAGKSQGRCIRPRLSPLDLWGPS